LSRMMLTCFAVSCQRMISDFCWLFVINGKISRSAISFFMMLLRRLMHASKLKNTNVLKAYEEMNKLSIRKCTRHAKG
jgi:hypothetical protein